MVSIGQERRETWGVMQYWGGIGIPETGEEARVQRDGGRRRVVFLGTGEADVPGTPGGLARGGGRESRGVVVLRNPWGWGEILWLYLRFMKCVVLWWFIDMDGFS